MILGGNWFMNKFTKLGFSMILACAISVVPNTLVFAGTISDQGQNQTAAGAVVTNPVTPSTTNYDAAKKQAQEEADVLTSKYGETSVQYALIDNGSIVLSGQSGVYSKESKAAPTNTNMYGIGSVSKMFTTTAVMQLAEQGKVKLDTPVTQYIPEFTMADPRYKDITVRMLLNHSSGLMGSTNTNTFLYENCDLTYYKKFLNSLKTQRLKADPGAFSVYCNDGFTLAQVLVEKVTGISFSEYIKTNITEPLHMDGTRTPADDFDRTRLAKTYFAGVAKALPTESLNIIGAGGIYSTAEDMCRFSQIFMDGSTSKVLSADSAKTMENEEYLKGLWPKGEDNVISYGLGWDSVNTYPFTRYDLKALVKGGDTTLYHASMVILPKENMAMVVLSSGGASTYNEVMAQGVLLSVLNAKGTVKEILPDKTYAKPVKATVPTDQKKYKGIYANNMALCKISIGEDGTLTLINVLAPNTGVQKFIYTGDGKYYTEDGSSYVAFKEEKNGNTYFYVSQNASLPGLGQIASYQYQLQKVTDHQVSAKVKAAWEKRDNKTYFLTNEKYSSQVYLLGTVATKMVLPKEIKGYCLNAAIIDKNTARNLVQIPGSGGRDLSDLNFYKAGGKEYLKSGESIYISEDAVKALSTKISFSCKIGKEGYATWYQIGKKAKNREISVSIPKNASYSVYDGKGACTCYSLVSDPGKVKLPSDGYIVFVGSPNAEFKVTYVK
jgi:CubicO group peptidase (beta-lactamase class C family)